LTARLYEALTLPSLLRVMLMLGLIWWIYDGYAWLTNAVAPTTRYRRALILLGMAGFLTIALAIPDGYSSAGWAFGAGYFLVNLVHSGLLSIAGGEGVWRAMHRLGPLNLASACLVLAGGFVPLPWRYWLWCAAFALQIAGPYLRPMGGFTVSPAHFVERHGLVMIVVFGESVSAIGTGVGIRLNPQLLAVALVGLVLAYYLWWAYFGGDDERAERTLAGIEDAKRVRVALVAYRYWHYFLLLGIVVLAAGLRRAIANAFGPVPLPEALALGGGLALFLAGDLAFRRVLWIGRPWYRLACLLAALAAVPLGLVYGAAELAVLAVALVVLLSFEGAGRRRAGPARYPR
jgi:low temperature requirement protein LtrA